MKKLCLTLFLGAVVFICGHAREHVTTPTEGPKLTITIEFGIRPYCTLGLAICRVDVGMNGMVGTAETFPDGNGGGSWLVSVPRERIAKYYPALLEKFDGNSTVTFEERYTVPVDVQKALGARGQLVIEASTPYPLKVVNDQFIITLPL